MMKNLNPMPKPKLQATLCIPSVTDYSVYSQFLYLEALRTIRNVKARQAMMTIRDQIKMVHSTSLIQTFKKQNGE